MSQKHEINCPYCNKQQAVIMMQPDCSEDHRLQCIECNRLFLLHVEVTVICSTRSFNQ